MGLDDYKWTRGEDGHLELYNAVLDVIAALIAAAGSGTAYIVAGTRAERLAYATPTAGMVWGETDYFGLWLYFDGAWTSLLDPSLKIHTAPTYKDADELYLGPLVLNINGTNYGLSTQTAFNCATALGSALAAGIWYFLGFAEPSGGGYALSTSEFVVTASPPTYNATRKGWYTASNERIINRFRTDGSGNIMSASVWAGLDGHRYTHSISTIINDTTPAYAATEAISADVPAWGVPILCGGWAALQDDAAGSYMSIFNGNDVQCGQLQIGAANTNDKGQWEAITNTSGQIKHQGQNLTYAVYQIYKLWDELPDGI